MHACKEYNKQHFSSLFQLNWNVYDMLNASSIFDL